jgi:hypothetical protein
MSLVIGLFAIGVEILNLIIFERKISFIWKKIKFESKYVEKPIEKNPKNMEIHEKIRSDV